MMECWICGADLKIYGADKEPFFTETCTSSDDLLDEVTTHFCSFDCLATWYEKMTGAEVIVNPPPELPQPDDHQQNR